MEITLDGNLDLQEKREPEMVIMWAYIICNFLVSIKDDSLKQKLQHYCRVNKVYGHNTQQY